MADGKEDTPKAVAKARQTRQIKMAQRGAAAAVALGVMAGGYVMYDRSENSDDYLHDAYAERNVTDMAVYVDRITPQDEANFLLRMANDGEFDAIRSLAGMGKFSDYARLNAFVELYETDKRDAFAALSGIIAIPQDLADRIYATSLNAKSTEDAEWIASLKAPSRQALDVYFVSSASNEDSFWFDYLRARVSFGRETLARAALDVVAAANAERLAILMDMADLTDQAPAFLHRAVQRNNADAVRLVLAQDSFSFTAQDLMPRVAEAVTLGATEVADLLLSHTDFAPVMLGEAYISALIAEKNDTASMILTRHAHGSADGIYTYLLSKSNGGGWVANVVSGLKRDGIFDAIFARAIIEREHKMSEDFLRGSGVTVEDVTRVYANLYGQGYAALVDASASANNTRADIVDEARSRAPYIMFNRFMMAYVFPDKPGIGEALSNAANRKNAAAMVRIVRDAGLTQTDVQDAFLAAVGEGNKDAYVFLLDRFGVDQATLDRGVALAFEKGEGGLINHLLAVELLSYERLDTMVAVAARGEDKRAVIDVVGTLAIPQDKQEQLLSHFDAPIQHAIRNQWRSLGR